MNSNRIILVALALGVVSASGVPLLAPANAAPAAKPASASDAERISRLHLSIEADEKALRKLEEADSGPEGEYQVAEAEFMALAAALREKQKAAEGLEAAGKDATAPRKEIEALKPKWQASRERFNLAIEHRKTRRQQAEALKKKIGRGKAELARLKGDQPDAGPQEKPRGLTAKPEAAPAAKPAEAPSGRVRLDKSVRQAKRKADAAEEEAKQARESARSMRERVKAIKADIALEQKLGEGASKKAALAAQGRAAAERELKDVKARAHTEDEAKAAQRKLAEADARVEQARAAQRASAERLEELQIELTAAQGEQAAAQDEARDKRAEAEKARADADWLESPSHPQNLLRWAITNGPRILAILVGIVLLHLLVRVVGQQLVGVMARNSQRGSEEDRQNRAETLIGIFHSAANIVVFGGGLLMLLESAGIPVVPLLGGAAVLGLAVAFGAQNLIRDYFAGFMVLMEDQYSVNDVVKIGDVSGTVEKITLRVTVVRDGAGIVHFIPHGSIGLVSNQTHGWSRALFEIGVAYHENVDRVMAVLKELGEQLRADPAYADLIMEGPEMLGVENLGDSSVVLKFHLKTKPMKQWTVKRELLRRIKNRFDELGIELPFPSRTVYHRYDEDAPADAKKHAA